jgi:hypothetical protein
MSPDDRLHDLLQIEVPDTASGEEEDAWSRGDNLLDHLRVASPCHASWEEMAGDNLVRFCQHCRKNVYNLSGMSRWDAADFVREAEGQLCVRFYRRQDGTLLTEDCPVGWRAARRRVIRRVGGIAAAVFALVGVKSPILYRDATMGMYDASGPIAPEYSMPPESGLSAAVLIGALLAIVRGRKADRQVASRAGPGPLTRTETQP